MGEITAISWCDHTFNPWIGCTKVSPACDGCYAEAMMDKRYGRVEWGAPGKGTGTRVRTSAGNWHQPIRWNKKAEAEGTRPFVFCSSLADVFDNQIPAEWRADLFELIRATPRLVWLLLTKRPQNIVKMVGQVGYLPINAALGTTIEDQERADRNLVELDRAKRCTPAIFSFVSCEPLLGRIVIPDGLMPDWVITGGETDQGGHKARPSHPDWYRSLQNGEWGREPLVGAMNGCFIGNRWSTEIPWNPGGVAEGVTGMAKIGRQRSGRLLDGVEHNARPETR